jgi:glycerophosphoryl diester phosphodiesterase
LTLVIAHRGASAYEPENSIAAFRRAVALGADGVELDIHETADHELVVGHDPEISGERIGDLSLSRVRAHLLPTGEPPPPLSEVLTAVGDEVTVFIEIKTLSEAGDSELFACIDAAPEPSRCQVHSFDHRVVRRLCAARAGLSGGVLSTSYLIDPITQIGAAGAATLWQQRDLIDASLVTEVHRRRYSIYAWTVDAPQDVRRLMSIGVDAICTNKPDVAREVIG